MSSKSINIAILPDEQTTHEAIQLSEELSKNFPTKFTLNHSNVFPHITIYQVEIPVDHLDQVSKELKLIARDLNKINFSLNEFDMFHGGILWWNTDNELFRDIQDKVVNKINPLRKGLILPGILNTDSLTSEETADKDNYGSLHISDHYQPHISITAVDTEHKNQIIESLDAKRFDAFSDRLIIGSLGEFGTVTGIIEEFGLS